ncbi:MAG: arsenite methyltransferase [Deltaproteobacteria bacterium]|nr:arsenite methyltransferase [Deltaproteobacteria bacterium]
MTDQSENEVRDNVRTHYAEIAKASGPTGASPGCCGGAKKSLEMGYSQTDLDAVPEGANMGLGCGNPQTLAKLREGQTVIDLGSGGGFDCFLAARSVGATGKVIGVDMTPEMLNKARANAEKLAATNVEFRLGEIEHLPVADQSADVVISNCVINLSPDKPQVAREAFRVLKRGGRLVVSDIVELKPMPEAFKAEAAKFSGCVAGAWPVAEVEALLKSVGFDPVEITIVSDSQKFIRDWFPGEDVEKYVASAHIEAVRPSSCCGDQKGCGGGNAPGSRTRT